MKKVKNVSLEIIRNRAPKVVFKDGVSLSVFGKVKVDIEKFDDFTPAYKVKRVKLNDEWDLSQVFITDNTYNLYLEKPTDIQKLTEAVLQKYKLEKYFEVKHE